jgi:hypothetical protein
MKIRDKKEISAIVREGKTLLEIRKGLTLIWQAVRSCFGSGKWHGEKPWIGGEKWRYND